MKPLAIQALYFALVALWFAQSASIAQEGDSSSTTNPKSQYGGFSSNADSLQVFYDYIHGQEMMKVEVGDELRRAIESIPVDLGAAIDLKQEAGLRDWLYDFLVAFSISGSDSLAVAFYMREGVNNSELIEQVSKEAKSQGILKGDTDTPAAFFNNFHKVMLNMAERDYFFQNVSFFDSVFRVFEMQEEYDSYESYLDTHGMLPKGSVLFEQIKLREEVEKHLQGGTALVFADIMFIVEEPEEFTTFEIPGRTPTFFRLLWDPEKAIWRHVEVYFSLGVPHDFLLFNFM